MKELHVRGDAVAQLDIALPPDRMSLVRFGRLLKRWRYVGAYGPEIMVCAGRVNVGLVRQSFWAVVEAGSPVRTGTRGVRFDGSRCVVDDSGVQLELLFDERAGVECVNPHHGRGYIWTRKQAGVGVRGRAVIDGRAVDVDSLGVVDDSAGYHARHTDWRWSAGVGHDADGRVVGWNLVTGLHDGPVSSERSLWVDGEASELAPVEFASDLSRVSGDGIALEFDAWPDSARVDDTNLLIAASSYRQPFGSFSGTLPGVELASAYGVMETHTVTW